LGQEQQVALEDFLTTRVISETATGREQCNLDVDGLRSELRNGQRLSSVELSKVESKVRILAFLVTKKSLKVSDSVFVSMNFGGVLSFPRPSSLSTSLKRRFDLQSIHQISY